MLTVYTAVRTLAGKYKKGKRRSKMRIHGVGEENEGEEGEGKETEEGSIIWFT